jgi:glycosyltransferase involved in cell wall biosynthesis
MTLDKLKIGLFNECFPPIQDGVSQVVENYARLMHEGGHDVTVATAKVPSFDYPHPYKVKNILSIPIPVRRPYRWGLPTWMVPWQPIYSFQSDIIHAHSPFTAARIALKLRKKYGIPVVTTFHSKFKDDFRASVPSDTIVNYMVKNIMQVFEAADEVWVGAPGVIDVMREYGYKGKVEVVPHAIDFD